MECAPCTFRPRDGGDDEDYLHHGINKRRDQLDQIEVDFDGFEQERVKKEGNNANARLNHS